MPTIINFQEEWQMPLAMATLADFRQWTRSPEHPAQGRFDFINGNIEVDMSPEDLFTHGSVKTQLAIVLGSLINDEDLGHLWIDRSRIVNADANLSVEPDIVFVSHEAIETGRVQLVPNVAGRRDRYIEVEGVVDLVVEIVSDNSVAKDTQRLRNAYAAAGVGEYWLVDARQDSIKFDILELHAGTYRDTPEDDNGFRRSLIFARAFRLTRSRGRGNYWQYQLETGRS
jgi:Uma2 family endonuclease